MPLLHKFCSEVPGGTTQRVSRLKTSLMLTSELKLFRMKKFLVLGSRSEQKTGLLVMYTQLEAELLAMYSKFEVEVGDLVRLELKAGLVIYSKVMLKAEDLLLLQKKLKKP